MHAFRLFLLAAALLLGGLPLAAHAGLTWDDQTKSVTAAPEELFVNVDFAFSNTGTDALTIDSIKTSCGCTTSSLDKKTYAPGEGGTFPVKVTYTRSEASPEPLRKLVYVSTKSGATSEVYILTISLTVPEYVQMEPKLLTWKEGEAPTTKYADLTVVHDAPIHLLGVEQDKALFTVALETVEDGRAYRLAVTPLDTAKKLGFATITVGSDFPAENGLSYSLAAMVRKPPTVEEPGWVERAWVKVLSLIP